MLAAQDPPGLEELAAHTRHAMDHDRVSGAWTPVTWTLITQLTNQVAAELAPRYPRRLAEFAVTRWILLREPLTECVAYQLGHRDFELPRPPRWLQGFGPRGHM